MIKKLRFSQILLKVFINFYLYFLQFFSFVFENFFTFFHNLLTIFQVLGKVRPNLISESQVLGFLSEDFFQVSKNFPA